MNFNGTPWLFLTFGSPGYDKKNLAKIVRFGQFGPKMPKNPYSAWGGAENVHPSYFRHFRPKISKNWQDLIIWANFPKFGQKSEFGLFLGLFHTWKFFGPPILPGGPIWAPRPKTPKIWWKSIFFPNSTKRGQKLSFCLVSLKFWPKMAKLAGGGVGDEIGPPGRIVVQKAQAE